MSLVPQSVLDAADAYYRDYPGCGGRSLHRFAEEVGRRYEASRAAFAHRLGVGDPSGIVFLRNSTEAINLVGQGLPWERGDRVLISDREHNSNLIVWQRLARERGIRVEVLPLDDGGAFDGDLLEERLARGVRLVSLFHTSNLDGRTLPVREIVERAHDRGARVLVDGCQAAPHAPGAVDRLGIDYYAVSGHKMLGPTGTGVLASSPDRLGELRPVLVGGETVEWSTLTDHALRPPPYRFEAGLQNYAGIIGAGAALDYLGALDPDEMRAHELALNERVTRAFAEEPRIRILGPPAAADRPSLVAFTLDGVDPHSAALFLDEASGVMVRSGRHCVHSWYAERGLEGNVRASFYVYNTVADVDALIAGVRELLARVPASGTSAGTRSGSPRAATVRRRAAGSTATAARSDRPRRRAGPGRAGSGAGSR
ncbi:Aminotransferase, class V/Cysteine desulfurase [mine drainage metagenome]|uniref:Aminotransferase, class V/Cysteine desulfurase n=1 Tax=mine drainage metagenome TaxID=410659 RepID=T1AC30_9ZZZZ